MAREVLRQLQQADLVEGEGVVGAWLLTQLCMQTLRQAVGRGGDRGGRGGGGGGGGGWTMARLVECLPRLRRYLCGSARQRPHQQTEVQAWLHRLNKPHKPLSQLIATSAPAPNAATAALNIIRLAA
jgi:hypothetical protein